MSDKPLSTTTRLLPWLVLITMLSVTYWQWDHERQLSQAALRAQFEFALHDVVSQVEQREAAYEQMLRGMQGLFTTTDLLDVEAATHYVRTLQLDANYYGIQALGVVAQVSAAQRSRHIADMQRRVAPHYQLTPAGDRDLYTPIVQNIPDIGQYVDILGIDTWQDPLRRAAMEQARDAGMPAITAKLRLAVDKQGAAPPGFVMYLPIYASGLPQNTLAQRRAHVLGWVYAAFHMEDFMASLYGKQTSGLSLAIYDGVMPNDANLMYRAGTASHSRATHQPTYSAKEYMVVAGHTWTLALSTLPEFEQKYERHLDNLIAIFGIGTSLTLSLLVYYMVLGRARALRLAQAMTLELRHMAQHDTLTGLPNRALFSDRVQQMLLAAQRNRHHIALIFIDLDQFKPVNDRYGHAVGDQLLQQVAQRLRDTIRASDTVGRLGGDEFVVLMGNLASPDLAVALAEKIRTAIGTSFNLNGHEVTISCSLGIAVYPEDGSDEDALTRSADQAMYRAKEQGRNRVQRGAETNGTLTKTVKQAEA